MLLLLQVRLNSIITHAHNTNTAHIKSIKGVVRHLRKQYLPKGVTFNLIGRYVGEEYLVVGRKMNLANY